MKGGHETDGRSKNAARRDQPELVRPEVRALLDLIAEELAAEYLRLTRTDQQKREPEEV